MLDFSQSEWFPGGVLQLDASVGGACRPEGDLRNVSASGPGPPPVEKI